MKKNKGIKVYKQRKKKRGNSNQIFSILGTCAVVLGLGIFGYYVVGLQIADFLDSTKSNKNDSSSTVAEVVTTEAKATEPTTKPVTEPVSTEKNASVTTAVSSVTTAPVSAISSETTPVTTRKQITVDEGGCFYLSTDDISSVDSLTAKLGSIDGYSSVVLPLKVTGGRVYYKSSVQSASLSGAVVSDLDISTMVKIIEENGFSPVAEICTVSDNIYPVTYKKSAYQFEDGVTGEWLDNRSDAGGKPWMSPFSDITKTYLSDLVYEITSAGIKNIICTGTEFPAFREKDLGYIGEIVRSETRYKGLTDLLNLLDSKAASNGGKVMIYVSASDVINSSCEAFRPDELGTMTAVININMNDFSEKSISDVMKSVKEKSGNMKLVPCIFADSLSASDLTSAVNTLKKDGYDYYMVR